VLERLTGSVPPSLAVVLVVFGTLPLWMSGIGLYSYLGVEVLIFCLYAIGYNLALGYTGLASFGHGAFFGIGAYAFGLTQFHLAPNLWLCALASVLAAAVAGAVVAAFISHRRGIYYSLLTIAFGETFYFIATKWHTVTRGEDGLLNIKRLPVALGPLSLSLQGNVQLYYFALAVLAVVAWLLWRLVRSPFGNAIQAIKQNDLRAAALGYNVWLYRWVSFTVSAGIAGLAGGLFAMAQGGAYVQVMALHASGVVVLMTLVGGGLVSFWGPVLGTVVYFVARDVLGALTEAWLLWYGLLFMAIIMFKPDGIAGMLHDLAARWRRTGPPGVPEPARVGHADP
jgi:branched-chain amino acid transport system permease protein